MARSPLCFAYYCSGHGYGHATRVSAFARHLLSLGEGEGRLVVYIVSSAPEHVFADSIACGAKYRFAEIDPVIVQPLAYRVDRRKSVDVLKKFLNKKDELLQHERQWLLDVQAHCVLSDAAFLGCLAARAAGLPSILITNFSFDSVYSYLSTPIPDIAPSSLPGPDDPHLEASLTTAQSRALELELITDDPIPHAELAPLVAQIHAGYRCAELLVRLPGHIPMPSFFVSPPLPSFDWVDVATRRLKPDVMAGLQMSINEAEILPGVTGKPIKRAVWQAPLLVRPPKLSVYTPEGRARFLLSIGIPEAKHQAKVLVVSFGGQVFRRPGSSRGSSRASSRSASQEDIAGLLDEARRRPNDKSMNKAEPPARGTCCAVSPKQASTAAFEMHVRRCSQPSPPHLGEPDMHSVPTGRLATPNHIYIPGAPPASKPLMSPSVEQSAFAISTIPLTPPVSFAGPIQGEGEGDAQGFPFGDGDEECGPRLLPDDSWIAVVCGVSKAQWAGGDSQGSGAEAERGRGGGDEGDELPDNFYVAPRDVYMPDLTAVGDVLLGKLGYGTVSECVDACTPFVYVSRPLFVEEHGLRLLLDQEGVGEELAREAYEAGEWSGAVVEAFVRGRKSKEGKRRDMAAGVGATQRGEEGRDLARRVVEWVGVRIAD